MAEITQTPIRSEYKDGSIVVSNVKSKIDNTTTSYSVVNTWYDGTPMDDSKVDQFGIYSKYKPTGEYLRENKPQWGELLLEVDTIEKLRALSTYYLFLIKIGYYKGVRLSGYYQKGDTPAPIDYNISNSNKPDDGGSILVIGSLKLEHLFLNGVDMFYYGAKCDSVTNDLDSYYRANLCAIANKTHVILSRSSYIVTVAPFTMGGAPLIGINKPKFIWDGNIQINVTNISNMYMDGIDFELRNNWGTNTTAFNCRSIIFSSGTNKNRRIKYTNLTCYAIVPEENGFYRAFQLIEEAGILGGEIRNITTYNMHRSIRTDYNVGGMSSTSRGLKVSDLTFYNAALGLGNNTWHSTIQNIELINTPEQSKNFQPKDLNPANPPAGFDCVLSSGSYTTYRNIRAINPIERCIYVQASNVYAENLYSVNGDGFKFVGYDETMIIENIRVFNSTWVITDDYANLQKFMSHSQFYFVKNIWVEGVKIINQTSANNAFLMEFGSMRNYAENVTIKDVEHIGNPMAAGFMRMALPTVPVNGSYVVYKNITIENVSFAVYRNKVNGTILRTGDQTGVPLNSWTGYSLADIIAENVTVRNCQVDNSQRQDKSLYYYRGIRNFIAEGNSSTALLEHPSGFIDPALANELNRQSERVSIKDSFKTNDIGLALGAVDAFKVSERSNIVFDENQSNAKLVVVNHKDGQISGSGTKTWFPTKRKNTNLNIANHNAIINSKSAFGQYIGEIKSGVLINALGNINPSGFITYNSGTKTLSVNSLNADRIMVVEVMLISDVSPFKLIPILTMSAIINSTGTTSTATELWGASSFVDLLGAKKILYNGRFGNQGSRVAFYSNNGTAAFISSYPSTDTVITNQELDIPEGAKFARFSCYDPANNNFYVLLKDANGEIITL